MKKSWIAGFLALLIICISFVASVSANTEATTAVEVFHYVALGDSITAGYEPHIVSEDQVYGFVDRLYEQALFYGRTEVQNYGILGLTSSGLHNLIRAAYDGKEVTAGDIQEKLVDPRASQLAGQTSQLKLDLEQADLITITIGGNDFLPLFNEIQGISDSEFDRLIEERFKKVGDNVRAAMDLIFAMNSEAIVLIADQYQPFPPLGSQSYTRLEKAKDLFSLHIEALVIDYRAKGYDLRAAYVAEPFTGKALSWTHILRTDIHPNQQGYQQIAEIFAKAIWERYHPAVNRDPLRIIVGGSELDIPFPPLLIKDTTFIPVREYAEALGAEVSWDEQLKRAVVVYQGQTVRYSVGSDLIYIGDREVRVSHPVELVNEKTYVPLRAISEGIGFDVQYVGQSRTAYINP